MYHDITAVTACCDRCRTVADPWYGEAHFADRAAAKTVLRSEGWQVRPDRMLCTTCVCEVNGHDWSDWYPCCCDGHIPGHEPPGQHGPCPANRDYRVCQHCSATEERPRQVA